MNGTLSQRARTPTALALARAITLWVPLVTTLTGPPAWAVIPTALVVSLVASAPLVTPSTVPLAKVVTRTALAASPTATAVSALPAMTLMALPAVDFPVANLAASVVTRAGVASGKSAVTS